MQTEAETSRSELGEQLTCGRILGIGVLSVGKLLPLCLLVSRSLVQGR